MKSVFSCNTATDFECVFFVFLPSLSRGFLVPHVVAV